MRYVDVKGRQPYIANDTTRQWIESIGRKNNLIKPQAVLRLATDSNHIRNATRTLYNPHPRGNVYTHAIMNNGLPGQKIPGLLNWSVTESLSQVTQQATFDCMNCLQLSTTTATVTDVTPAGTNTVNDGIGNSLYHADTIVGSWAQDSLFAVERVTGPGGRDSNGNKNVEYVKDSFGYYFREANVVYRMYADQIFTIDNGSAFPNPAIPDDADNDVVLDTSWDRDQHGAGAYFILVGQEVMRVCQLNGNTFHVPAGGRAVNGIIQTHHAGEKVTLLGHGESTGEYCAMGYLSLDDFHPESGLLRPGTCLSSYEGYGDIVGPLSHKFDPNRNYEFTGYWFVDSVEPNLGEDGVPKVTVTVKNAGAMYEEQKIDLDTIQRMKNQFGQWTINGKTLFSAAGATRSIPGDWADYTAWDPTDQYAYPLQIKVEYGQHYAFYQHMQDTQNGLTCIQCHQELADFLKTHKAENSRDRPVGRHIYKESIRVLRENAGPIKTYIRLMATMAAAAWDHPAYGTELSQKFTKIPNQLFDNIRNIYSGTCYNGQVDFQLAKSDPSFDFSTPGYDDKVILSRRKDLTCPFQSSYDNAPFSQPMQDLAAVNGATFWVDRNGYPVFKPYGWNMRPEAAGYRHLTAQSKPDPNGPRNPANPHHLPGHNGEWTMSYGSSISTYSVNVTKDQIITQQWVTASTAFDLDNSGNGFTITASGTGYDDRGNYIFYAPLSGHKQGLMLTGGVQQIDTTTLDNQYLGLDWNTNPASWGMVENLQGVDTVMDARPPMYDGNRPVGINTGGVHESVRRVQQVMNFMLVRGYMNQIVLKGITYFTLNINGKFDEVTQAAVSQFHDVLAHGFFGEPGLPGATISGSTFSYKGHSNSVNVWARATYLAAKDYFTTHAYEIKTDIWWYTRNGKTWDEYIAAITGLPIPFTKGNAPKASQTSTAYSTPLYVIDDKGLQAEVANWYRTFSQAVINIGNRQVNQTVDQAIQRSIACNLADPRVQPGDTIFCEIPGHLSATGPDGGTHPPFTNGIYVTDIQRTLDLESGTYTATYSGTRQQGLFGAGLTESVNAGSYFLTDLSQI